MQGLTRVIHTWRLNTFGTRRVLRLSVFVALGLVVCKDRKDRYIGLNTYGDLHGSECDDLEHMEIGTMRICTESVMSKTLDSLAS